MLTEPDVTLTDYGLTIECALFVYLLLRGKNLKRPLRTGFSGLFAFTGLTALSGGTVHGFFLDGQTIGHRILWPFTLMAIGGTAWSTWRIGAHLLFSKRRVRFFSTFNNISLLIYCVVVLFLIQDFWIAIVVYFPASLFLAISFLVLYQRNGDPGALIGLSGVFLTFLAAGVQRSGYSPVPGFFNHNALYHLIQAGGLLLLFLAARSLLEPVRTKGDSI